MLVHWQFVRRRLERSIPKQRRHARASLSCSTHRDSMRKQPNLRPPKNQRTKKEERKAHLVE